MAHSMSVSITLALRDQLTGNIRGVVNGLNQIGKVAQEVNRNAVGVGMASQFNRVQGQIRTLVNDVRTLSREFTNAARALQGGSGGGSFAQRQITDMRQLLTLQQQAIANNQRMLAGPGGGRGPGGAGGGGGGGGLLGRSGFSPNASLVDRAQYRGVNMMERSLGEGAMSYDRARTRLDLLSSVIGGGAVAEAERMAADLSRQFTEFTRADILDTFGEIVTQFRTAQEGMQMMPELMRMQQLSVLGGDSRQNARSGMLSIVCAIGLSGRLTDNQGNLTIDETRRFIDMFTRARIVGGADVTPDQAFQLIKYMKTGAQGLDDTGLLMSFLAMPDMRASSFGNSLNMMFRGQTGRATKEAQDAQARAGLITGSQHRTTPSGPEKFVMDGVTDEEGLRSNPFLWTQQHIIDNYLVRQRGLNMNTATPAQIAIALRPLASNSSHENMLNQLVNTMQEIRNQARFALGVNLGRENLDRLRRGSLNVGVVSGWSGIMDILGTIAENFKPLYLPALQRFGEILQGIARMTDPKSGNPYLSMGLLGAGGIGGFMLLRRLMGGMGPMGRILVGGGLGLGLGGGVTEALMGGLMARGLGGAGATAAAGAAGAAAAASWRARFLRGLWAIPGGILRMGLWGAAFSGIAAIVDNWQAVSERLKAIWADLTSALPAFLGGGGGGYGAFARGPNVTQAGSDLEAWLQGIDRSIKEWAQSTQLGQWMQQNGWAVTEQQRLGQDAQRTLQLGYAGLTPGSPVPVTVVGKGSTQPINVQVFVSVAQTNASPEAIGAAAGNAVGSRLRGALNDAPSAVD